MNEDSTLSSVVLPVPVPPETRMFSRASTQASSSSAISGVRVPKPIRSSTVNGSLANLRMVSVEPLKASGGMIALTREPSARRASTSGEDSSIRRPTARDDALDDPAQVLLGGEADAGARSSLPCRST